MLITSLSLKQQLIYVWGYLFSPYFLIPQGPHGKKKLKNVADVEKLDTEGGS